MLFVYNAAAFIEMKDMSEASVLRPTGYVVCMRTLIHHGTMVLTLDLIMTRPAVNTVITKIKLSLTVRSCVTSYPDKTCTCAPPAGFFQGLTR